MTAKLWKRIRCVGCRQIPGVKAANPERVLVEVLRHFIDENRHPITGVAHRLGLSYSTLWKVLDREQAPKAGLISEPR